MVADKIDMSLDDIIASNRRGRGGRGGQNRRGSSNRGRNQRDGNGFARRGSGGGGPVRRGRGRNNRGSPYYRPNSLPDKWEHDMYDGAGRGSSGGSGRRSEGVSTGSHLQISNLDFGVTESDIKELFSEFGKLKKAILNYDGSGRSHGTADVVFERKADALKALKTYNGVPLDGRPMKIEAVSTQLVSVESPAPRRFSGGNSSRGNNNKFGRGTNRGFRGSGNRGRGNRGRRSQRDVPSKDELDKELDNYVEKVNT